MQAVMYAPIRKTEGREWILSDEIHALPELARGAASKLDGEIPGWARVNPVVRVVRVLIIEDGAADDAHPFHRSST